MFNPLVSVIIPTYNRAVFIKDAIESVLNQTYKNYEIIVVDDGSKDNTRELVLCFGNRVKYIHIENSGPSKARNTGIKVSRGEFIAFLDSDDLWDSSKLEEQLSIFSDDQDLGILFTNARHINEMGVVIKTSIAANNYLYQGNFLKDILEINFPIASDTVLLKRDILSDIGLFDESLRLSEDLDLWVRIALRFKVGYLNNPLVSIRMHDVSLIHQTSRADIWLHSIKVIGRYKKELSKYVQDFNFYEAKFFDHAGNTVLLEGDRLRAIGYYLQALTLTPLYLKRYKDLLRCILPLNYLRHRYETLFRETFGE